MNERPSKFFPKTRKQTYQLAIRSPHFQRLKSIGWAKNDGCCEICHRLTPQRLRRAHHIHYETLGCERLEDLWYLCNNCHNKAHGTYKPIIVANAYSEYCFSLEHEAANSPNKKKRA